MCDARNNQPGGFGVFDDLSTDDLLALIHAVSLEDEVDYKYLKVLTSAYLARPEAPKVDVNAAWENLMRVVDGGEFQYSITVAENPTQAKKFVHLFKTRRRPVRAALIAAIVVVMLLATSIVALAVPSIRNTIERWTDEVFISKNTTGDNDIVQEPTWTLEASYPDLQSALTANGITEPLAPQWLPEGYEVESVNYEKGDLGQRFVALYTNKNNDAIIINLTVYDEVRVQYEKDDGEVMKYDTHGVMHYIMSDSNTTKAIWTHDNCECTISVPREILIDDIVKMIDSIYER